MRITGYRKKVIIENLSKSFPQKSLPEILKVKNDFYKNLSDVIIETLKSFTITSKEIKKRVVFTNPELAENFIHQNQPFITLSTHQCNWEWQLLSSCLLGFPIDAAYKKLTNKTVDQMMLSMRSAFGANLIESKSFLRTAIKRKNIVRGIAMVGDQRPPKNSEFRTDFLHQDTVMFTGAEKLAKAFNYPVLFMEMKRVKRGKYTITLSPISAPPYSKEDDYSITKKYCELTERSIYENPGDWLWSHKRWKY